MKRSPLQIKACTPAVSGGVAPSSATRTHTAPSALLMQHLFQLVENREQDLVQIRRYRFCRNKERASDKLLFGTDYSF